MDATDPVRANRRGSARLLEDARTQLTLDLLTGAAAAVPFAIVATRVGRISRGGALVGVLFAAVIYAAFYLAGFAVLGSALVLTIVASRIAEGRDRASRMPAHEKRSAANIAANCGIGTFAAAVELAGLGSPECNAVYFVAAIAAGASDTVASEIGRSFGGAPRTFPTWRLASPGTPGAISGVGTIAGIISAAIIAAPASVLWLLTAPWVAVIAAVCAAASLAESWLSTRFEHRGLLGNNALNAMNTAIAAALGLIACLSHHT